MRKHNNTLSIPCGKCNGTGRISLDSGFYPVFAETLELLRTRKTEMNGVGLAKLMNIEPTAMNNRLVWLEKHGFAVGRWHGRQRLWKAAMGGA